MLTTCLIIGTLVTGCTPADRPSPAEAVAVLLASVPPFVYQPPPDAPTDAHTGDPFWTPSYPPPPPEPLTAPFWPSPGWSGGSDSGWSSYVGQPYHGRPLGRPTYRRPASGHEAAPVAGRPAPRRRR